MACSRNSPPADPHLLALRCSQHVGRSGESCGAPRLRFTPRCIPRFWSGAGTAEAIGLQPVDAKADRLSHFLLHRLDYRAGGAPKVAGARRVSAEPPQTYQTACKPGFVRRGLSPPRDGHSSATPVARRLQQPTRTAGSGHGSRQLLRLRGTAAAPSLFGLAPGGVCRAVGVAAGAVRSYRTVSPLPASTLASGGRRSVLCGTFPGLAPAGRYPAPHVHGARTFLPRPPFGIGSGGRPAD
jgi:hypothetical protein